jgi:hypothetical protein
MAYRIDRLAIHGGIAMLVSRRSTAPPEAASPMVSMDAAITDEGGGKGRWRWH